jgi:hypothetical protein
MADKQISDLTEGTDGATALFHGVEGGNSRKFTGEDIAKHPTRTSQALSGATVDVSVPAGCTWFRFAIVNAVMASAGGAPYASLRHTSNTVDQAWTGISETAEVDSDISAVAGFAIAGASTGTSRDLFGEVIAPRASRKTIASGVGRSGGDITKRSVVADAAQDDSTLRFVGNGANFSSGTAEIEWFYN